MVTKIDSNATGLRIAEESTLGVLPGSPVWYPQEPNSYNDFGGNLSLVARNPINQSRQNQKGSVVDLDASGGYNTDLTQSNLNRVLQGFFFANMRETFSTLPINGTQIEITAVDGSGEEYQAASGLDDFLVNHLVLASGFTLASNNGLKMLTTVAADGVVAAGLDTETPPADAKLQVVGYQFASATLNVAIVGGLPRLSRASGSFDFTDLGLMVGQWIFIGGDLTAEKFATAANNGFARIRDISATYIEFDKTETTMVNETGTGKTIRIFYGNVLKNESDPDLIVRKTYQLERTLGHDGVGIQSEYLIGSVANTLNLTMGTAGKVTADLAFVSTDFEQRSGTTGVKSGDRPALTSGDMFNTSSDVRRIKMNIIDPVSANPTALFGYVTDFTLNINNGVTPNKAIGVLGAFDTSAANFVVGGNVTAYFSTIAAVNAIRSNSDVTLDVILAKNNAGVVFDIPLLALGDGRLNVQQDQAITLPLSLQAAESENNYTLLFTEFAYLPTLAM